MMEESSPMCMDTCNVPNGRLHPSEETSKEEPPGRVTRWLTVEPVLFTFYIAMGTFYPTVQNIAYYKVCMQEFNDTEICNNLHNASHADEEDVVQSKTSYFFMYEHLCFEIPAITLSFIYGALSDYTSRRLAMALPIFGQCLAMIVYILSAVYIESDVRFLLLGRFIIGLFGGWISCCIASFSYLSAISTDSLRTTRISIAEGTINIAFALAYLFCGVMLDNTSYVFVFSFVALVTLSCVIYILVWIQEPYIEKCHLSAQEAYETTERLPLLQTIWYRVRDSVLCVFRRREGNKRQQLLVLLATVITGMVSYDVMWMVGYLYLKRQPLSWSQTTYGFWLSFGQTLKGLFLFIAVPLLKQKFHCQDTTLILVSLLTSAAAEVLFGLSTVTWMVFLVNVIGIMTSTKMTCIRSLQSQLVPTHELGQMFAAVGSLQSISGIIGSLIFNNLYPLTLDFWPGFCFSLGASMVIIPLGLTWWLRKDLKKYSEVYQPLYELDVKGDEFRLLNDDMSPKGYTDDVNIDNIKNSDSIPVYSALEGSDSDD